MRRFVLTAATVVLAVAVTAGVAGATSPTNFHNDFEHKDDATPKKSWFNAGTGTIRREPSGYVSDYASGVDSAHKQWHARLGTSGCTGPATCFGPFTRWGEPNAGDFPKDGYATEIDVYLDTAWAVGKPDRRFDWSSAINDDEGGFRRDFVFNAGTSPAGDGSFDINASTNATRSGAFPQNPCPNPPTPSPTQPAGCRTPLKITESGWYTLRHRFYDDGGVLAVDMSVSNHDGVLKEWKVSQPTDDIETTGRARYGWFVINEINNLAADCSKLLKPGKEHPEIGASCTSQGDDE